ncbi:SDR family oxidoreductase [Clostridium botulinum]|nr:SDR family oxidoreductase [Clostridium botulinum]MCS4515855.1 SDR family oxidoreductase [Clostridium botulinum]MCS4522503.1 SDR family oxidoreductase [Clostridium botulinum]
MNIILGATGQIGTMLVDNLLEKGQPVKAVIRNYSKAQELKIKVLRFLLQILLK